MTDSLIEISDKFISFFIEKNGVRKDKELLDFIKEQSINITLPEIINILIAYKLIERSSVHAELKHLTPNGFKAAIIGIKKYIEEIELDKELDRRVKIATITTSRWAIGISILSLIISIVVPVLIEKQKNEVPSKTEIQNMIDNNNSKRDSTNHNCNFK
jgi:hypothetical protein